MKTESVHMTQTADDEADDDEVDIRNDFSCLFIPQSKELSDNPFVLLVNDRKPQHEKKTSIKFKRPKSCA